MLWIAFIFQYLWDTKQPFDYIYKHGVCCELLSFFSIFGIQNNPTHTRANHLRVVNCFHFSVSLGYKTTCVIANTTDYQLWIAFIFQYLWDTKQHKIDMIEQVKRCELLSFFSIFGIQNNTLCDRWARYVVVNCFHFSVSLGYKTTLYFVF